MKYYLKILFIVFITIGCQQSFRESELEKYLAANWTTPEEYVIDKFKNHDYVLIGEYHRIRHDVELIQKLIPQLYANGIYILAFEFGNYQEQFLVDSLLALPYFDRELAKRINFKWLPLWGYKEYIDIYKAAWEVNHSDASDHKNKFRVVNLDAQPNPCDENEGVDRDVFMADVIFKEIISKNQKALIYSGMHHAFTKYHQPNFDFERKTLNGFRKRMGNIIYDSLKEKAFSIYLHAAWFSDKGLDSLSVLPVNGAIDSVMKYFHNRPVGFDVANTPFGKLKSNDSYYALGYPDFTLDNYCDGYVYLNEFKNYQPITMEENYITINNIGTVKAFLSCINISKERIDSLNVENANRMLLEDVRDHFDHLVK